MGIIEKSLMQNKHSPPSQQQQHRLGSRLLDPMLLGRMDQEPQPQQLAGDKYLALFNKQIELSNLLIGGHLLLVERGIILRGRVHC